MLAQHCRPPRAGRAGRPSHPSPPVPGPGPARENAGLPPQPVSQASPSGHRHCPQEALCKEALGVPALPGGLQGPHAPSVLSMSRCAVGPDPGTRFRWVVQGGGGVGSAGRTDSGSLKPTPHLLPDAHSTSTGLCFRDIPEASQPRSHHPIQASCPPTGTLVHLLPGLEDSPPRITFLSRPSEKVLTVTPHPRPAPSLRVPAVSQGSASGGQSPARGPCAQCPRSQPRLGR